MIMKTSANVKNWCVAPKMPKNRKNNFRKISKYFFENQHIFCILGKFGGLIQGWCNDKLSYEGI